MGTQVVLLNPISALLFSFAAFKFFTDRIPYEEFHLVKFFGLDYIYYAKKVPTRMPFISSYCDEIQSE